MPLLGARGKRRSIYSKGEINRLIAWLLHPLFDTNQAFSLVDAVLHGFVEQNMGVRIQNLEGASIILWILK